MRKHQLHSFQWKILARNWRENDTDIIQGAEPSLMSRLATSKECTRGLGEGKWEFVVALTLY
jgi:hypothetical protein